ncbi:hypothetical protein DSO57_1038262 [Entomophthora muscae]|uniref:Uncharacterized protein n=1 Tax=Entomophthora muscae TaxID=34485 RepID=A0ACC2TL41_9FUNG|nr:hypothetical protein DSO57_1038262 [Entomophthora muscae]
MYEILDDAIINSFGFDAFVEPLPIPHHRLRSIIMASSDVKACITIPQNKTTKAFVVLACPRDNQTMTKTLTNLHRFINSNIPTATNLELIHIPPSILENLHIVRKSKL